MPDLVAFDRDLLDCAGSMMRYTVCWKLSPDTSGAKSPDGNGGFVAALKTLRHPKISVLQQLYSRGELRISDWISLVLVGFLESLRLRIWSVGDSHISQRRRDVGHPRPFSAVAMRARSLPPSDVPLRSGRLSLRLGPVDIREFA